MLEILLLQIFITFTCLLAGVIFYSFLDPSNIDTKPLIFFPFTGLALVAFLSQIVVLFAPINIYTTAIVLLAFIITGFIKRKQTTQVVRRLRSFIVNLSWPAICLMIALWLMFVTIAAGPIIMDDTESYHLQMIKWTQEYGTVPGIANLHERFGFNSSWFSTISFFVLFESKFNIYTALNGMISVWLSWFLVAQIKNWFSGKTNHSVTALQVCSFMLLLFLVSAWNMLRGNAANTNYDFITTAMLLLLFLKATGLTQNASHAQVGFEWILWPVYLFTVRMINGPMCIITLYGFYLLVRSGAWKKAIVFASIGAAFIIPFFVRNFILSGYPLYPSTAFNFFPADWKVDPLIREQLMEFIKYYNRVSTHFLNIEATRHLGFPGWIGAWFRYMFFYDKVTVIAGLLSFAFIFFFRRKFFAQASAMAKVFIITCILQLIFWMWSAPDPRFVNGPLLCGVAFLIVSLIRREWLLPRFFRLQYLLIPFTVVIFFYTVAKWHGDKNYRNYYHAATIPLPPVKTVTLDNMVLRIPEKILDNWNPRCYNTELPCLYIVNPNLAARGTTIGAGFRLNK